MPLSGFRCELTHQPVPFEECLACAREKHPCQFSYEVLHAMSENPEQRKDAGISVTTCTGCARQGYYSLAEEFYQYPHALYPALRGTAFHELIERHPEPGAYYEHRFSCPVGLGTLSGQVDKLVPAQRLIVDFKTKDKLPESLPEEYVWQVNAYRLLVGDGTVVASGGKGERLAVGSKVALEIERLGLIFFTGMEMRKYNVPLIPLDQVAWYFGERVNAIVGALAGEALPERIARVPALNKLCVSWCPFFERCTLDG